MSRNDKSRFYSLLPLIYHQRDLMQQVSNGSRPLQDLTAIMDETLKNLENDIENLYENWFIETCDEWITPYIGDLVDAKFLCSVKGAPISSRAYVANTIHYRKRKGTVAILEKIARDITGWDAHVVEFFRFLSTTQNINHKRLENQCTPSIVDPELIGLVGTAFDSVPHTLDVRHIKNGCGYYNAVNMGVFLWRLTAYPVRKARAFWHGGGKYSFSSIGVDLPLFNNPVVPCSAGLSQEINVSGPIRREAAEKYLKRYYGENRSVFLEVERAGVITPVDEQQIVICDLSDVDELGNWRLPVEGGLDSLSGKVAIDPVLGRVLFLEKMETERKVFVSYYYGFSADIGGGFYRRELYESGIVDMKKYLISAAMGGSVRGYVSSINQALALWAQDGKPNALFEIVDSEIYTEDLSKIDIPSGRTLILRSAQEQRATLSAVKKKNNAPHYVTVFGGEGSCLVFDGLMLNQNLRLQVIKADTALKASNLKKLVIHQCLFVPLTDVDDIGASITVEGNDYLTVMLNKSVSGKIFMNNSRGQLVLKEAIVDKGSVESAVECFEASLENSTVFGRCCFDILNFASNVIFNDTVKVKRRQEGCVRFSYIAHRFEKNSSASKMPRCYHCQPESAASSVVPFFTSEKYGAPGYAQLHRCSVKEILEGADNQSEMGVFNQVYQSHRINNLVAAFAEYLPFRLEAGVILVT